MIGRSRDLLAWLAVALLAFLLFGRVLCILANKWMTDEAVSHGPLVPLISLALVWMRRERIAACPRSPSWWGLLLLALSITIHLLSVLVDVPMLSAAMIPPFIAGLVLYLGGRALLLELAFPIAFLWFMVKIPAAVTDPVSIPLQSLASRTAASVGQAIGVPVTREGVILNLPHFRLFVVEACSGLRMIAALAAMGTLIAYLTPCRLPGKLVLIALVLPLSILANAIRVTTILLVAWYWGGDAAMGYLHVGSGIALFLAVLVPLVALGRVLSWQNVFGCPSS